MGIFDFFFLFRSPTDQCLYLVREHDPTALSTSFDELKLFEEQSGDILSVRKHCLLTVETPDDVPPPKKKKKRKKETLKNFIKMYMQFPTGCSVQYLNYHCWLRYG